MREKVIWAVKALPKNIRKQLFPLPEQVAAFLESNAAETSAGASSTSKDSKNTVNRIAQTADVQPMPFFEALRKFVQRRIGSLSRRTPGTTGSSRPICE